MVASVDGLVHHQQDGDTPSRASSGLRNVVDSNKDGSSFVGHGDMRQTPWYATSALIIADIVGSGILALPYAFAQLGWTAGLIMLVACWPLNFFTGYLLNKVHLAYPKCVTFGDVGEQLFGKAGGYIGYGALYLYVLLVMGDYFIVLSNAMQDMFFHWELCRPVAGLITACLLVPTNQLRTLNGLALLSVFSFVTILGTMAIYLGVVLTEKGGDVPCSSDTLAPVNGPMPLAKVISKFVFAFSGQKIFLEMQAEMANPAEFVRSMNLAFPLLVSAYGLISVVTLARCRDTSPTYVLHALGYDSARTWANVMIFAHIVVSYTIGQQVLSRAVAIRLMPAALEDNVGARIRWFFVTSCLMVIAFVLSNAIPLFEDFVSLISALLSTQMTFSFPCLLFLGARHKGKLVDLSPGLDKVLVIVIYLVLVMDVLLTITGSIKAVSGIVEHAKEQSAPFSCLCSALQCQSE